MGKWHPEAESFVCSFSLHSLSPVAQEFSGVGIGLKDIILLLSTFYYMLPKARTLDLIFYRHRQVMKPYSNVFAGKINEFESRCVRACFENDFSLITLQIALAFKHSEPPSF